MIVSAVAAVLPACFRSCGSEPEHVCSDQIVLLSDEHDITYYSESLGFRINIILQHRHFKYILDA